MKTGFQARLVLAFGCAMFLASFFLPLGAMHSPLGMLKWTLEAVSSSDSTGEAIAYAGAAVVIAYPYVWALLVAATALRNMRQPVGSPWLHVALQTIGGLVLMALSIMLLWLHDPWLPVRAQWAAAIVPIAILLPIWGAALRTSRKKRTWLVIGLGFLPQLLFQTVLAFVSVGRAGHAWGFAIGSAGCLFALAGGFRLAMTSDQETSVDG
jgi:hypothetical protein